MASRAKKKEAAPRPAGDGAAPAEGGSANAAAEPPPRHADTGGLPRPTGVPGADTEGGPGPEEAPGRPGGTALPDEALRAMPAAAGAPAAEPAPVSMASPGAQGCCPRRQRRRLRQALDEGRRRAGAVPRDPTWQWERRVREHELRTEAVALVTACQEQGQSPAEVARQLEVPARTLRGWCQASRHSGWLPQALGRPHERLRAGQGQEVVSYLHGHGPWVGVPALRVEFPTAARAELRDLLRLYRYLWAEAHPRESHVLHWLRVGAVWAMDFTRMPRRIDGYYRHVFAVRDLASGMQLCWRAVPDLTGAAVQSELRLLFTIYGAPLVLKSDNGSAFRAEGQKRFLRRWRVWPLYSPPGVAGYNGAIEASIGSLKRRTEFVAYQAGRAQEWTKQDLEAARELANETARPGKGKSATARQSWEERRPPSRSEQEAFGRAVHQAEESIRAEEGIGQGVDQDHYEEAALYRRVLTQVLVERGLLTMTRRRIPQKFFGQKVAII